MPTIVPWAVRARGACVTGAPAGAAAFAPRACFATPQSMTSTSPNGPTMTFSGLRSRCSTPRACANATASHDALEQAQPLGQAAAAAANASRRGPSTNFIA